MDRQREYGIDILRILAMFGIVVLHSLSHGALTGATRLSTHYEMGFLVEALVYGSVNCFAIISGYIGVNSDFKYRRIIKLWLEVVFYGLLITVFFKYAPFIKNSSYFNDSPFTKALTPVMSGTYWYFTAYFAMFFFTPFINRAMRNITLTQAVIFIATVIVIFIALPYFLKLSFVDLRLGYSMIWLTIMYATGAALRSINNNIRVNKGKYIYLALYVVMTVCAWTAKYIIEKNSDKTDDVFLQYTSIFIFSAAVFGTLFFANIKVGNKKCQTLLKAVSPAAFAVYLIHVHPLFFELPIWGRLRSLLHHSPAVMVLGVLGNAIWIFIMCIGIDLLRIQLFRLLHINWAIDKIADSICKKEPDNK